MPSSIISHDALILLKSAQLLEYLQKPATDRIKMGHIKFLNHTYRVILQPGAYWFSLLTQSSRKELAKVHISLQHNKRNLALAFSLIMPILQANNLGNIKFINNKGINDRSTDSNVQGKEMVIYLKTPRELSVFRKRVLPFLDDMLEKAGVIANIPPIASYPFSDKGYVFTRSAYSLTGTYIDANFYKSHFFTLSDPLFSNAHPLMELRAKVKSPKAQMPSVLKLKTFTTDKINNSLATCINTALRQLARVLLRRDDSKIIDATTIHNTVIIQAILQSKLTARATVQEPKTLSVLTKHLLHIIQVLEDNKIVSFSTHSIASIAPAFYKLLILFCDYFNEMIDDTDQILMAFDEFVNNNYLQCLTELTLNLLRQPSTDQIYKQIPSYLFDKKFSVSQIKAFIRDIYLAQPCIDISSTKALVFALSKPGKSTSASAALGIRWQVKSADLFSLATHRGYFSESPKAALPLKTTVLAETETALVTECPALIKKTLP